MKIFDRCREQISVLFILAAVIGAGPVTADEFTTSSSWDSDMHGWTRWPTETKLVQAGENEIGSTSPTGMGEVRFVVSPGDDPMDDLAPRLLKKALKQDAYNGLPTSDWVIETAIMQPDPNNLGIDGIPVPYAGAFYPARVSGLSGVSSLAGLVLRSDSNNWILWGQEDNMAMGLRIVIGGVEQAPSEWDEDVTGLYQYFRIRKRSNDAEHVRYYFEASGLANLDDTYNDPNKPHPGGRYGWKTFGYWEDASGAFDNESTFRYGLMAGTPGTGSSYRVQFGYFFENVPVDEMEEFNSPYSSEKPYTCGPYEVEQGLSEGSTVMAQGGKLVFDVKSGDRFAPPSSYDAPTVLKRPKYSDWIIDVQIVDQAGGGTLRSNAGLLVYSDDSDSWLHFAQYPGAGNGPIMTVGVVLNNGSYMTVLSAPGLQNHLRIRKAGNVYTFQRSNDPKDWTTIGTWTDSGNALAGASYGLMASSIGDSGDVHVTFDDFREFPQPNKAVKSVTNGTQIAQLIGAGSINQGADIRGGDLGSMLEYGSQVYMMFGDNTDSNGVHRPNEIAIIGSDTNFSDGVTFDSLIDAPIPAPNRQEFGEPTCIPTTGFALTAQQQIYYHFQSVYHWSVPQSHWDDNFSALARWMPTQGWTKLLSGNHPLWSGDSNFLQCSMVKHGSNPTYLYVFGTPSGGYGGVCLARAPLAHVGDYSYYEYFCGAAGWQDWCHEDEAVIIIPAPVREFCVQYSPVLQRWIFMGANDNMRDIELRDAANPEGPWSNPITAVDHKSSLAKANGQTNYIYGGYMTPKYMTGNPGDPVSDIYFTMTKKKVYRVFWDRITVSTN